MTKRKRKATDCNDTQPLPLAAGAAVSGPAAARRSPRAWLLAGLVALFVARLLFPTESAVYGDGMPVVMLWIALAVMWLLSEIGKPRWEVRFGWVDAAVCGLVAWHTLAGVAAAVSRSPRPAVNMTWEWFGMGLSFLLARQLVRTRREVRAVAAVMAALAVALAGHGLYQYAVEMPAMRAAYAADPAAALRQAELGFEPGTPQAKLFEDRLHSTEPMAAFALTNSLAGYLGPWLVVLLGVALLGSPTRKAVLFGLVCAAPVAVCLVLTKSRSAYAALAVGLILLGGLAWYGRRGGRVPWRWVLAAASVLVLAVGLATAAGGLDREVATEAGKSLGYRLQYWQSTLRMIADRPVLGCGPGNYQFEYTRYKLPEASEEVADPHNFLFEIWATAGTPALVLLTLVLGGFFWHACRTVRAAHEGSGNRMPPRAEDEPDAAWFAIAGGAAGFLLSVPLGLLSWAPPGLAPIWLGMPLAAMAVALLAGWVREGRMPPWLPAVGVLVLLVNLLAAGALGFPGVSGTLWLLLAVGLADERRRTTPRAAALGALVLTLIAALACHQTAYEPVLQSRAALQTAREEALAGRAQRVEECLRNAAVADPMAAEPWRDLAAYMLQAWEQTGSVHAMERFREADQATAQREPNSATAWHASGDWHLRVFERTGNPADAERAVASHARAVALYPNSGRHRARLAEAYQAAGNVTLFRQEAAEALRLDAMTPHTDKKLPDAVREQLERGAPAVP
ncbi:MAG: O-antigen ligase family protein [Patescibacteria group bacterium]|nr:O-antigen ligase family protein [Patescibacteria group bacterium]